MRAKGRDLWSLGDRQLLAFPDNAANRWSQAGWAAYFSQATQDAGVRVYVRFGMGIDVQLDRDMIMNAPLVAREIVLRSERDAAVTGAIARDLPLARMAAAANSRLRRGVSPQPGSFPYVNKVMDTAAPTEALILPWMGFPGWQSEAETPYLAVAVPDETKKPDSFYAEVADRYLWLASKVNRPAEELAKANGVPATTVHRWIKEARRRGLLPPGQRGRGEASR
jgi:hypothetical protein